MDKAKSGNKGPNDKGSKSVPCSGSAGAMHVRGGVMPKGGPMQTGTKSGSGGKR